MPVLHGAARLDIAQQHAMLFTPGAHGTTDELRAIIHVDLFGQTTRLGQTFEHANDAQAWQAGVGFDGQAFRCVLIDDRQYAEGAAVCQRIGNEVHRPTLVCSMQVGLRGSGEPLPAVSTFASSHVQPEIPIGSINPFMIDVTTFSAQQRG